MRKSLDEAKTRYPFVVMVTENISWKICDLLVGDGCLIREVESVSPKPGAATSYASPRFAEVWTKLRAWNLLEFETVVALDADMLVAQNMDELFEIKLGDDQIAAAHACVCNPQQITSYPKSWNPANCAYTYWAAGEAQRSRGPVCSYFNAGLIVLKPNQRAFMSLASRLQSFDDLSALNFAEQDLLNDYYRSNWQPIPYIYNALKTLSRCHSEMWDIAKIKNIHYILSKPWEIDRTGNDFYSDLNALWWRTREKIRQTIEA